MQNHAVHHAINGPTGIVGRTAGLVRNLWLPACLILGPPLAGCADLQQTLDRDEVVADPDFDPQIPGPGSWPAFHADGGNHGSHFVATEFALEPKWSVDVGPVLYSSPVIGGNGRIYLGDLNGRLYAIDSLGNVDWSLDFSNAMASPPAMINSSPAVSDNGAIYVVSTEVLDDEEYRSTLHLVGPTGTVIRSTPMPDGGYTTASPKIWRHEGEDVIFLYARLGFDTSSLVVFNKFGEVIAQQPMACQTPVTGSSGVWDVIGEVLELFHDAFGGDGGFGIGFDTGGEIGPLSDAFGWLEPSVAIVDEPGLAEDGRPLIVLVDRACFLKLFRWDEPALTELWSNRHDFLFQSSPTVFEAAGTIILGAEDGHVRGYDLLSGEEKWDTDLDLGSIMGTPATLGGSIAYVIADRGLAILDAGDGTRLNALSSSGRSVASPALSGSHVVVSTENELATYSVNLQDHVHILQGRGGLASPAIGADGTIYAVTAGDNQSRVLRAYGGLQPILPEAPELGVIAP
jgi:outer membrane protein assembly factor BamB